MTARIPHAETLTAAETDLVRATLPNNLAGLDEEELLELHARVRRARNKYSTLYRRQGAASVRAKRSRGAAESSNHRTLVKAEVFEDALGRVSHRLAAEAKSQARELRSQRLDAARTARSGAPARRNAPGESPARRGGATGGPQRARRTPIQTKVSASTKGRGKRNQARRDARPR